MSLDYIGGPNCQCQHCNDARYRKRMGGDLSTVIVQANQCTDAEPFRASFTIPLVEHFGSPVLVDSDQVMRNPVVLCGIERQPVGRITNLCASPTTLGLHVRFLTGISNHALVDRVRKLVACQIIPLVIQFRASGRPQEAQGSHEKVVPVELVGVSFEAVPVTPQDMTRKEPPTLVFSGEPPVWVRPEPVGEVNRNGRAFAPGAFVANGPLGAGGASGGLVPAGTFVPDTATRCYHLTVRWDVEQNAVTCQLCGETWTKPPAEISRDALTLELVRLRRYGSAQEQAEALLAKWRVVERP